MKKNSEVGAPPEAPPARSGGAALIVAVIALLLAAAALGAAAYVYQQSEVSLQQSSAATTAATEAQRASAAALSEATTTQIDAVRTDTTQQIEAVRNELSASQVAAGQRLDATLQAFRQTLADEAGRVDAQLGELAQRLSEQEAGLIDKLGEAATSLSGTIQEGLQQSDITLGQVRRNLELALQDSVSDGQLAIEQTTTQLQTLTNDVRTRLERELNSAKEHFGERVSALGSALQSTQEQVNRNQRAWILAEIEYLLRTAQHRVVLAGDLKSAVAALKAADAQVGELGELELLPVREQISREIGELQSRSQPDLEGLLFTLSRLSEQSLYLPVMQKDSTADAGGSLLGETGLGAGIDAQLQDLFSVTRSNRAVERRLTGPSAAQVTVAEALRLNLQAAQLAVSRKDETSYREYMQRCLDHVMAHYDVNLAQVAAFVEDLQEAAAAPIVPQYETLGQALILLEPFIAAGGQ